MNDNIQRLVRLQEISFEVREIKEQLAAIPVRSTGLEEEFQRKIADIGADRLRHEQLVADRARLAKETEDLQQRLQNAQKKLMQVHNQREYSAALNEIDANKAHLAQLENRILELDAAIEQLAGPATEADQLMADERGRVEAAKKQLDEEAALIDARLAAAQKLQDELTQNLPASYLQRFDSLFKARGGIAIAPVDLKTSSCGACHVRLRPQIVSLVRRGEELTLCENYSCRRILYIAETAGGPSTASPPSGRETPAGSASGSGAPPVPDAPGGGAGLPQAAPHG